MELLLEVSFIPSDKQEDEENIVIDEVAEAGSGVTPELSLGLPDITVRETRDGSGVPDDTRRINNGSPSGSRTSGTTSVHETFSRRQRTLIDKIKALQTNPVGQLETLKTKAARYLVDLQKLGVQQIVQKYESDPNFLDYFGANPDDLLLWFEDTQSII